MEGKTMNKTQDVVIENKQMRLVIAGDGMVKSLIYKPTRTECLIKNTNVPLSVIIEPRPYQNEVKLAYLTKKTKFKSNVVRKQGNKLIIGYELIPWQVIVNIKITNHYIAFTIEAFELTEEYGIAMNEPPISGIWFLQLPVRNMEHWGDWLNVMWSKKIAVNVLAAGPDTNIDSEEYDEYRILQAGSDVNVKLTGVTAVLVTCAADRLLDKIEVIEKAYGLPHGVKSRRHELYNASYYWTYDINPSNVDEHIRRAKTGGFRLMNIYYSAFLESAGYRLIGNYDVYAKEYPKGKDDLRAILTKIKNAGIIPGCHFLHSHLGRDSRYITPVPDHRLNLLRVFTLARPFELHDTTIYVEQNPIHSTTTKDRKVLKIGTELVSYEGFTITPPYTFFGCVRGIDRTTINTQPKGAMFGLLDVSEFGATSVYINQYSDLQDEIAHAIAGLWDAGFEFFYFDGSEGVNPPFWYHVANAQYRVFSKLKPEPIFAEGAAKTHFSWHMLTGGNAFDVFSPEKLKDETIRHPLREAERMQNNFTRLNFGWLGYWLPDDKTVGTQPDQLEFVTSKAAAWDCPVSILADLLKLAKHPRTDDNFEVFRRWEQVRKNKWLTKKQKELLRNPGQEFTLLLNEKNNPELIPYDRVNHFAGGSRDVIAYIFERKKSLYAVYWHISSDVELEFPIKPDELFVLENIGKENAAIPGSRANTSIIPAGKRRYLKTSILKKNDFIKSLEKARII